MHWHHGGCSRPMKRIVPLYFWAFLVLVTAPAYFAYNWAYSDSLFLESFFIDLFKEGGKWSSWSLATSAAYVPDMLLYPLAYYLLPNVMDRLFFITLCQVLLICAGMLWVVKAATGKPSILSQWVVFSICALFVYLSYRDVMILLAYSANFLMAAHIFALFAIALLVSLVQQTTPLKWPSLLLLAAFTLVGYLNGKMFIVWFIAPALVTLSLCFAVAFAYKQPHIRSLLLLIATILVSALFARFLDSIITVWDSLELVNRTRFNLDMAFDSVPKLFRTIHTLFTRYDTLYQAIILVWFIGLGIAFYQPVRWALQSYALKRYGSFLPKARALKTKAALTRQYGLYFLCLFTIILLPVSLVSITASGEFRDLSSLRFYQIFITLPFLILAGALNLYAPTFSESRLAYGFSVGTVSCLVLIFLFNFESIKPRPFTVADVRNHKGTWEMELTQCLDANKERYNLRYGIGTFWVARAVTLLSSKGVRIYNAHTYPAEMIHYMSNIDWYTGEGHGAHPHPFYNFIVVTGDLNKNEIIARNGMPRDTLKCSNTEILIYDGNFHHRFMESSRLVTNRLKFEYGLHDAFSTSSPQQNTWLKLAPGRYQATFMYASPNAAANATVGELRLHTESGPLTTLSPLKAHASGLSSTTVSFEVPASFVNKRISVNLHFVRINNAAILPRYLIIKRL